MRNIRLFYVLESILALSGGIILPVYVLYFRHYEISLFQVALLAAVFEATIIVFEVPTGIFADRFGRKPSTAIGFALLAVSGLIFFAFRGFVGFLVAEIVFGIAETFISGALEALAVDSLNEDEKKSRLPRLFANRTIYKTSFLLVGMILGGLLAGYALYALFLPIIFAAVGGCLISFLLVEPKRVGRPAPKKTKHLSSLVRLVFRNRAVMTLFAVGLLSNFVYEPADQFWQVLFSEIRSIDPSYFGLITAGGLILVIISARFTQRLYDRLTLYLSGCFVLIALALYIAAEWSTYPAIAGIVVYFAMKELIRPAISTHLNRLFASENRATLLSGYNLTCSVGEVIAGVIAGLLAAKYGVVFVFYVAAAIALFTIGIFILLPNRTGLNPQMKSG